MSSHQDGHVTDKMNDPHQLSQTAETKAADGPDSLQTAET